MEDVRTVTQKVSKAEIQLMLSLLMQCAPRLSRPAIKI